VNTCAFPGDTDNQRREKMTIEISELGFTEKELQERVVDGICERLMCKESSDGEGGARR